MRSLPKEGQHLKLADVGQTASPRVPSVAVSQPLEFVGYLARKHAIAGNLLSNLTAPDRPGREKRLRDLWEVTDLSAEDFANEIAHFYKLPRIDLPQLIARHHWLTGSLIVSFAR